MPNHAEASVRRRSAKVYSLRYTEWFDCPRFDFDAMTRNTMALFPLPPGWRYSRNLRSRTMTLSGTGSRKQIGMALAGEFLGWAGRNEAELLAALHKYTGGAVSADAAFVQPDAEPVVIDPDCKCGRKL